MKIVAYIDGSCEPINPGGTMGYGVLIHIDGQRVTHSGKVAASRHNSNNVAEYLALKWILDFIEANDEINEVHVNSDSQMLIQQMGGTWKIKRGLYKELAIECRKKTLELERKEVNFNFIWIPREQNVEADSLSKKY